MTGKMICRDFRGQVCCMVVVVPVIIVECTRLVLTVRVGNMEMQPGNLRPKERKAQEQHC